MSTFDIILITLLILGGIKGYMNGFIIEFFSFLAFFIGLFLALEFTVPVSVSFFGESNYFHVAAILIFFGLFVLLTLAIKAGAKAAKKVIDMTFFGTLDNLMGVGAGALKTAFIISVVFWVLESVGFDLMERYSDDTFVFAYIVDMGPTVFGWLSEVIPYVRDLMDSMKQLPKGNNTFITAI